MTRGAAALAALVVLLGACGGDEVAPDVASEVAVEVAADTVEPVETAVVEEVFETVEETEAVEETEIVAETEVVEDIAVWVPPDDPFDRGVMQVALGITDLSRSLLTLEPRTPVSATCAVEGVDLPCKVALAGDERTLRALDGKPSFTLRFEGENTLGLAALELDAQLDEASQLRTLVGHLVFRRLGLAAPRASLARVTVDGVDFGVYTAVETPDSPHFIAANTGSTGGSLFVATSTVDLWPWQVPEMVLARGSEGDRARLAELSSALETFRIERLEGTPLELDKVLDDRVDLDVFLEAMAAEIWLGHRAGYPRGTRDYALHVSGLKVFFVPLHLGRGLDPGDQADPWWSGGRLLRHCMEDSECRPRWGLVLDKVLSHLDAADVLAEVSALRFLVNAELVNDPRAELSADAIEGAQDALMLVLADRSRWIAANLRCTDPADVDHDEDGASNCLDDCDDDAASVHPGAPETCNLRDDNCNGVLDEGAGCPECLAVDGLALCYAPKTYADAKAHCSARGGALVSVHDQATFDTTRRLALGLQLNSWWIGLDDRQTEGTFMWADGTPYNPAELAAWSGGEPNDSGGNEDCAHITSWAGGQWNDLDCSRALPFVCDDP